MEALSYWRGCHEEPLEKAYSLLIKIAATHDRKAFCAKRLKRATSIIDKLKREKGMQLKRMQDIGGCRAILSSKKRARKLIRGLTRHDDIRIRNDYMDTAKFDGYRSTHLIGKFSGIEDRQYDIELQVRTALQHSWATAVEIYDLFNSEALKMDRGDEQWKKFFKVAGDIFEEIEQIAVLSGANSSRIVSGLTDRIVKKSSSQGKALKEKIREMYLLSKKLDVVVKFEGYTNSLSIAGDRIENQNIEGFVLLTIDLNEKTVAEKYFEIGDFSKAKEEYLKAELRTVNSEGVIVALVSTDAMGGVREAYPNYFADSHLFILAVRVATEAHRRINPSPISRLFDRLNS
ncbi:MAG: RelA/SpoT domain-containing protein [Verrucomicrobiota bacterium]